jgi:hypothetical protein
MIANGNDRKNPITMLATSSHNVIANPVRL